MLAKLGQRRPRLCKRLDLGVVPFQVLQRVRTEWMWKNHNNAAVRGSSIDLDLCFVDGTLQPIPRDGKARGYVTEGAGQVTLSRGLHLYLPYGSKRGTGVQPDFLQGRTRSSTDPRGRGGGRVRVTYCGSASGGSPGFGHESDIT